MIELTLVAYAVLIGASAIYTTIELFMMFRSENEELKKHRLTHIVILTLLVLFNISLVLTDTRNGTDEFIELLSEPEALMQYQFMCLFLYFAGIHLSEEVTTMEEYYGPKEK